MARVGFAGVAALAALCLVDAKGTAYRGGAAAAGTSGAWRHTGRGGGYGYYYVGGAMYYHHATYHHRSYSNYRSEQSEEWRQRNPARPGTNCETPAYGPTPEATQAWIVSEFVADKPAWNLTAPEIEVDFFNELMFRSPCQGPTQAVSLFICSFKGEINTTRRLTDEEKRDTRVCQFNGDVQSLPAPHAAARRSLLQSDAAADGPEYSVIEVAIGALNKESATQLTAAMMEMAADTDGAITQYYNLQPSAQERFTVVDIDSAAALRPAVATLAAVLAVALAVF